MISFILTSLISSALGLALFGTMNNGVPRSGINGGDGAGRLLIVDLRPPIPATGATAAEPAAKTSAPSRPVPPTHAPETGSIPSRLSRTPPSASVAAPQGSLDGGKMIVGGAAANLPPADLLHYQTALEDRLARYRVYPADARAAGQQGVVAVHFEIGRDGTVRSAWIEQSSGIGSLDREALEAVLRAQPLPALPAGWPDQLDITLPVTFRLG